MLDTVPDVFIINLILKQLWEVSVIISVFMAEKI